MRYVRIFLLFFEHVYQYRSRIFVWFLVSFIHPLIYLLFWSGRNSNSFINNVGAIDIRTYYLLYIIAGGFFVHVEEDARPDILEGQLSMFLMKPFSYLRLKFFSELPWRLIQGSMGFIVLMFITAVLAIPLQIQLNATQIIQVILISLLGYSILFLFKMIILISAFWTTDISGLQQFMEMLIIIFSGFIMPISLLSESIAQFIYATPFPYMIYYPVIAVLGVISLPDLFRICIIQIFWIVAFYIFYTMLWHKGLRKYSAIGL